MIWFSGLVKARRSRGPICREFEEGLAWNSRAQGGACLSLADKFGDDLSWLSGECHGQKRPDRRFKLAGRFRVQPVASVWNFGEFGVVK